jgi:hypothetical protein
MFPSGTVQSGLENVPITQGRTTLQFPWPGAMTPDPAKRSQTNTAHANSFGFAYANEIASAFMTSKQATIFATGSIIVREKLRDSTSARPEVLVVMLKRESRFNPRANDWEFLTISGDMQKIVKREKEGKCLQCHASEAKNDFVFRYPAP